MGEVERDGVSAEREMQQKELSRGLKMFAVGCARGSSGIIREKRSD
jgi:hypothetical protein